MHAKNKPSLAKATSLETRAPPLTWRSRGEECGIVAVHLPAGESTAPLLVHRGLFALQHRGQEAAGIACASIDNDLEVTTPESTRGTLGSAEEEGEHIHYLRGQGLVSECLPLLQVKNCLSGAKALGHVRYSTVPCESAQNIQPFVAKTPYGHLAIAHNGNLKNAPELRKELEKRGALLSTTMDTELIVHLIALSGATTFAAALKAAAAAIQGAYSLVILCAGRLYAFRDAYGIRPLVLGRLKNGGLMVASETCALKAVEAHYEREIAPGELLELKEAARGEALLEVESTQLLAAEERKACVFELVYFARPDSVVFGQSVHQARLAMGVELAKADSEVLPRLHRESETLPTIVVPIPDSGVTAAIGYARESGLPLEPALIRSHYIGRTFILPDQDSRKHSLHLKLSVIKEAVQGKRVLLVDDSLVRGNTARLIVEMVRQAGAREVWLRVASPPLAWPCYLGIDTPDRQELIINTCKTIAGVANFIGVDDLRYLSLAGLQRATLGQSFCFGCMNGEYPV